MLCNEKEVEVTLGDVLLFAFVGIFIIGIAFSGAIIVGGLICAGVFLARFVSRKLPELWERIP